MPGSVSLWLRLSTFCGMISPIIAFVFIGLAIFNAPWFSWTENALSDLGREGTEAILFNTGLILAGIIYIPFAWRVRHFYQNQILGRIGAFVLLLAAIFLCAIGFFPETAGEIHFYVSVAFFVSILITLLLQASAMLLMPSQTKLGLFTTFLIIVGFTPWILNPWKGVAIPETISALAATVWSFLMGIKFLKET